MELPPQDEQLLAAHLESCQSCSRFQHQIDQVIQAAAELPIPEDAVPTNLESLARMIMQQLPQPKGSFLSVFAGLFGGGKPKEAKQKAAPAAQQPSGSKFPHVRRKPAEETAEAKPAGKGARRPTSEQEATAARLRGISRKTDTVGDQSTSGTRSLGEKFGMAAPQGEQHGEGPLTLAESIRRKVSEQLSGTKVEEAKEAHGLAAGEHEAGWETPGEAPAWGPPGQPGADQPGIGSPQGQPGFGGPQGQPGFGGPQGQPDPWGEPQGQPDAWGQAQQPGGSWGEAQPDAWGTQPSQSGGWGAPATQQPWGQPAPADDWGASQGASPGDIWGQAPAPTPQGGAWEEPGWGGSQGSQPSAQDTGWGGAQGQAQAGAAGQDAWGGGAGWGSDSWGGAQANPPGGTPAQEPPRPTWSEEAEQIQTGMWQAFTPSESLGAGAKPAAPSMPQPPGPQPASRFDVPIQERIKQEQAPPAPPAADRWDVPIQERMQQTAQPAAQPPQDRWDVPIQERMRVAGGQEPQGAPPAPAAAGGVPVGDIMNRLSNILGDSGQAAQQPAPELQSPAAAQDRWDVPIQERMSQPPAPPAPPAQDRWDVPIQERMQQAQPQAAAPPADRWEVPIQERMKQEQAPAADRWDVPIQERMQQPAGAPPSPEQRFDVPIQERLGQQAAAAQSQPSGGLFKNLDDSAMDRLFSENLGVTEAAKQSAAAAPSPPAPPTPPAAPVPPAAPSPPPPAPPTITPVAPRTQQAAAPAPGGSGGLFSLDDSAIDKLFGENLGVTEPARPVSAPQAQPAAGAPPPPPAPAPAPQATGWSQAAPPGPAPVPPAPVPPAPPQPAAASAQGGGLFSLDDEAMDRLFGENLGVKEAAAPLPKVNVNEAVQSIRTAAGAPAQPAQPAPAPAAAAAPAPAAPPPKVEGVGRLSKTDTTVETGSGKISSIGKFLLDQQDLTKIGKLAGSDLSDTKMRILTMEAAQELQTLLHTIGQQAGVVGSVIVGHDGILIANTMPQTVDPESVGVWALGIYLNTDGVVKKMGHNHIHQVVCRTPIGYLIIADFGGGILVTVTEGSQTELLMPLMRSITQLVAQ